RSTPPTRSGSASRPPRVPTSSARSASSKTDREPAQSLRPDFRAAAGRRPRRPRDGRWVEAIKLLRASGGMGLKEAKEMLDRQRAAGMPAKAAIADRQRAPGEVRRIPGVVWVVLIVVLAVVALVAIRLGWAPG